MKVFRGGRTVKRRSRCARLSSYNGAPAALRMYIHYALCSLSLRVGDSKTTVSKYAAVIHYTTVVKIEALMCSLPVLLDQSEIVLRYVTRKT